MINQNYFKKVIGKPKPNELGMVIRSQSYAKVLAKAGSETIPKGSTLFGRGKRLAPENVRDDKIVHPLGKLSDKCNQ